MTELVAATQDTEKQPTKKDAYVAITTMFYIALVCLVVAISVLLLIRFRTYRRRVSNAIGLEQEKPKQEEGKLWVDPWVESARRLTVEPQEKGPTDDDDTVDIDPSDLGPDDIEPSGPPTFPDDPPHDPNGKGGR